MSYGKYDTGKRQTIIYVELENVIIVSGYLFTAVTIWRVISKLRTLNRKKY